MGRQTCVWWTYGIIDNRFALAGKLNPAWWNSVKEMSGLVNSRKGKYTNFTYCLKLSIILRAQKYPLQLLSYNVFCDCFHENKSLVVVNERFQRKKFLIPASVVLCSFSIQRTWYSFANFWSWRKWNKVQNWFLISQLYPFIV